MPCHPPYAGIRYCKAVWNDIIYLAAVSPNTIEADLTKYEASAEKGGHREPVPAIVESWNGSTSSAIMAQCLAAVYNPPSDKFPTRSADDRIKLEIVKMTTIDKKESGLLIAMFSAALLARIAGASLIGLSYPMDNDEPEYYAPAIHITNGEGYRKIPQQSPDQVAHLTAYRMPGPSLVLALGMKLFGSSVATARFISAVFSALAAPLMYLLARRIAPYQAAVLAGLACAVYPTYVYYSLRIFSEPYFIPMFLLSLLITSYAVDSDKSWSSFIAGIAWGLTAMIRPHAVPMAGLIAIYLIVIHRQRLRGTFVVLGVVMFLVPWLIRNELVLGHPVLLATESGETLLGSNNPYVVADPELHGMWLSPMKIPEYTERLRPIRDEVERSRVQAEIAMDYLKTNPGNIPLLAYYKLRRWLTPVTVSRGLIRFLVLASYGTLLALLAAGLVLRVFARSASLSIALLCTFVFLLITAVYWGGLTRGRVPLEVLWIPWGAWGAWNLLLRLDHRGLATKYFNRILPRFIPTICEPDAPVSTKV